MVCVVPKGVTTPGAVFPLRIDPGDRFIKTAQGAPFLVHGDTPWMLNVQLNNTQIDTYLNWAVLSGITAILIEAPGFLFGDGGAAGNNAVLDVDGNAPFTTMTPNFDWVLNNSYWARVDYIVFGAKARGIAVFLAPAYLGAQTTNEGCLAQITAASAGTLQTYGFTLATRYASAGNIVWVMGGDNSTDATNRAKQWNIATGIRAVNPSAIVTAHTARADGEPWNQWGPGGDDLAGFNLNNFYSSQAADNGYSLAASAYSRSPTTPAFLIEGRYENEGTLAEFRRTSYHAMLSGACGHFPGNKPRWDFGSAAWGTGGAANALATALNTTGTLQMMYLKGLLTAYKWWLLTPRTDATLVSAPNPLGTGTGRVCPAIYTDAGQTVALIYTPAVDLTIVMTNFAQSSVRIRRLDVATGVYTLVGTFANTGSQTVTVAAESVVVCD